MGIILAVKNILSEAKDTLEGNGPYYCGTMYCSHSTQVQADACRAKACADHEEWRRKYFAGEVPMMTKEEVIAKFPQYADPSNWGEAEEARPVASSKNWCAFEEADNQLDLPFGEEPCDQLKLSS